MRGNSCYVSSGAADGQLDGDIEPGDESGREETDGDTGPEDEGREGMVFVPAGSLLMGSDDSRCPHDAPLHEVWLDAFWIDRLEVTNGAYGTCVRSGACTAPPYVGSATREHYFDSSTFTNYPVLGVGWEMARSFCVWVGKRLPTEAEWEKAARGGCEIGGAADRCEPDFDVRDYPWGAGPPSCSVANAHVDCFGGDTAPVGSFPADASPYGVMDMGGNVGEMVEDYFLSEYYSVSPYANPPGPTLDEVVGPFCDRGNPELCHVARGATFQGVSADDSFVLSCRYSTRAPFPALGVRCAASTR